MSPPPVRWRVGTWRVCQAALALAAALALLSAFGRVLRQAVLQGELRREATARHSAATWRCNTMKSMPLRDACLRELNAPPPQEVLITAQPGATDGPRP